MNFSRIQLTPRLILTGIVLTALPLLIVTAVLFFQTEKMTAVATEKIQNQVFQDLGHFTKGVYSTCKAQQVLLTHGVEASLNVARHALRQQGDVSLSESVVVWDAVNQYTRETSQVSLPGFEVGGRRIEKNSSGNRESWIVDDVKALVGGTCTLFQKMTPEGDMLRISTNVFEKNGARAIGTYIPAVNPSGLTNPVIDTLMKGKIFRGRAFVVDQWYITAYEPIMDADHRVIGAVYVGVPEEGMESLRQAIMGVRVGTKGYMFVLDSKGRYVISKEGARDGETVWDATDADGNYFIRELCERAVRLNEGESGELTYGWKNPGEAASMEKITVFMYFKPWDWIICAGAYTHELYAATDEIAQIRKAGNLRLAFIFTVTIVVACTLWLFIARGITGPIREGIWFAENMSSGDFSHTLDIDRKDETGRLADALNRMTDQLNTSFRDVTAGVDILMSAAGDLLGMSGDLKTALDQAAETTTEVSDQSHDMREQMRSVAGVMEMATDNVNQISDAAGEMSTTIGAIAKNASAAGEISETAVDKALSAASLIQELDAEARSINVVTETIAEISEQTNLLALNATIEAARAGSAGKGFAVVADEIKSLSRLTAGATREIKEKVERIQVATRRSIAEINGVSDVNKKANDLVGNIAAAIEEQTAATKEIRLNVENGTAGIAKISQNVSAAAGIGVDVTEKISGVNQGVRRLSERSSELAKNADQLNTLSDNLKTSVGRFILKSEG